MSKSLSKNIISNKFITIMQNKKEFKTTPIEKIKITS